MFEYFVTSFKVIVGVVTNERLAIAGLVAIGLLLIWIILSLVFSFQIRFSKRARKINEYVGKNGLSSESRAGLDELVKDMPSEFQREYQNYKEGSGLPSKYIKRFESLDVELSGGVFNQNKSIMKTYMNFVFACLMLLSIAIISTETNLTGYLLAEASIVPLGFLLVAKVLYYVYTAIRQYEYRVAVDEFNDMLDNLDTAHKSAHQTTETPKEQVAEVNVDVDELFSKLKNYLENWKEEVLKAAPIQVAPANSYAENIDDLEETLIEDEPDIENETEVNAEPEVEVYQTKGEPKAKKIEPKLDFETLVEPEKKQEKAETQKRGRGRPKKEVNQSGEFVIKNDKDFEEALLRAEKLMRKNEEPLSASQTKRIEKQIKELVDAMTKYKENR